MELALITAQQVAVLFLLIGTGMVAVKTGVLKLENKQALSNLLVYIIVPAMVVNSYRMEFSTRSAKPAVCIAITQGFVSFFNALLYAVVLYYDPGRPLGTAHHAQQVACCSC